MIIMGHGWKRQVQHIKAVTTVKSGREFVLDCCLLASMTSSFRSRENSNLEL